MTISLKFNMFSITLIILKIWGLIDCTNKCARNQIFFHLSKVAFLSSFFLYVQYLRCMTLIITEVLPRCVFFVCLNAVFLMMASLNASSVDFVPRPRYINISSVVEFWRWWVLKSKLFAPKSTCSKEILHTNYFEPLMIFSR